MSFHHTPEYREKMSQIQRERQKNPEVMAKVMRSLELAQAKNQETRWKKQPSDADKYRVVPNPDDINKYRVNPDTYKAPGFIVTEPTNTITVESPSQNAEILNLFNSISSDLTSINTKMARLHQLLED